jgi:hypothetical protein
MSWVHRKFAMHRPSGADRVILDLEDAVARSGGRGAISVNGHKPLIDKAQRLIAHGAQA